MTSDDVGIGHGDAGSKSCFLFSGTLYCAKGNYEFGISRVIKSLEPYNKKLGTDTWFYAKRCFLSLIENLAKHMISVRDSVIQVLQNKSYRLLLNKQTICFAYTNAYLLRLRTSLPYAGVPPVLGSLRDLRPRGEDGDRGPAGGGHLGLAGETGAMSDVYLG